MRAEEAPRHANDGSLNGNNATESCNISAANQGADFTSPSQSVGGSAALATSAGDEAPCRQLSKSIWHEICHFLQPANIKGRKSR
jgi:hypothetical protein